MPPTEPAIAAADDQGQLQETKAEDPVPSVELLRHVPSALSDHVGDSVEAIEGLDDESASPLVLKAIVVRLIERQHSDREAFQSALKAYQDLTERLTIEMTEARSLLASQVESARLEREILVTEFLDRLDVLSAKISTSASRFTVELEAKDRLLQDQELRVLAYAGQAATAQSVIDDIQKSSSWRYTSPLRFLSRIMSRGTPPAPR